MNLLERIDIALAQANKSRGDLALHLDCSVQTISNLKRRPGSTLRPEKVARAARYLHADIYWLCTGEGGKYVPEAPPSSAPSFSFLATEVATWLDNMEPPERERCFVAMYQLCNGHKYAHKAPSEPT